MESRDGMNDYLEEWELGRTVVTPSVSGEVECPSSPSAPSSSGDDSEPSSEPGSTRAASSSSSSYVNNYTEEDVGTMWKEIFGERMLPSKTLRRIVSTRTSQEE